MRFNHIAAFAVYGLRGDSIEEDVNLVAMTEPAVNARLTKSPDKYLLTLDRGLALATLVLSGFFGESQEGEQARLLTEEVAKIQARRSDQAKDAAILIIDIAGDAEVNLSGPKNEVDGSVIIFDAVDKEKLRSEHAPVVSSILASIALSLQRTEPIEKLRDGIYLLDPEGKVYHSFSPSAGTLSVGLASPITSELVESANSYAEDLLRSPDVASIVHLLNQSMDKSADRLRSFLSAWAGLEILINKTFSSYESRFTDAIKQRGTSYALDSYLDRVSKVMSDKYRLMDRFIIVSHFLAPTTSEDDSRQFKKIKDIRDRLLHGGDVSVEDLPLNETQDLLLRYITGHIRMEKS